MGERGPIHRDSRERCSRQPLFASLWPAKTRRIDRGNGLIGATIADGMTAAFIILAMSFGVIVPKLAFCREIDAGEAVRLPPMPLWPGEGVGARSWLVLQNWLARR
jgi:hypothetical protein